MVPRAKHQGMLTAALGAADPAAPSADISEAIPAPGYLTASICLSLKSGSYVNSIINVSKSEVCSLYMEGRTGSACTLVLGFS